MSSQSGSAATGSATKRQSSLAGPRTSRSDSGSHVGRTKSNVSGSYYQETEIDDDEDEEEGVQLPLPPQAAHTTTRKVAGLGPPMGSSNYAPGMLHRLALQGLTAEVVALLKMREGEEYGSHSTTPLVDVNMYDDQGMTALHCASASGRIDTCQVLLEERADPNLGKQNTGYAALHFACEGGHLEVVKLLVRHRAGD